MDIKKCPKCGHDIVMLEYSYGSPKRYDGISEIMCPENTDKSITNSHFRIGRWCGQELERGETENVFCDGKKSHK